MIKKKERLCSSNILRDLEYLKLDWHLAKKKRETLSQGLRFLLIYLLKFHKPQIRYLVPTEFNDHLLDIYCEEPRSYCRQPLPATPIFVIFFKIMRAASSKERLWPVITALRIKQFSRGWTLEWKTFSTTFTALFFQWLLKQRFNHHSKCGLNVHHTEEQLSVSVFLTILLHVSVFLTILLHHYWLMNRSFHVYIHAGINVSSSSPTSLLFQGSLEKRPEAATI